MLAFASSWSSWSISTDLTDLDNFARSIADSGYAVLIPIIKKDYGKAGTKKWAASGGALKNSFNFLYGKKDIDFRVSFDKSSIFGL